jgi:hypothetical protein
MNAKKLIILSVAMLAALTSTTLAQSKRDAHSMLFPPDATYAGKSLGEWGQDYWFWAATIPGPADNFPGINDGSSFQINQQGPVFFLGDSFNWSDQIPEGTPNPGSDYAPEQRHVTVSAHTALYIGFEGNYSAVRFQSFLDARGLTAEQFAQENLSDLLSFESINASLEIDGASVPIDTSADSPYLNVSYISGLPMPADSAIRQFFYAPTTTVPDPIAYLFIADFSALIKPLSIGEHTVKTRVFDSGYGYAFSELQAVDWHITVTP